MRVWFVFLLTLVLAAPVAADRLSLLGVDSGLRGGRSDDDALLDTVQRQTLRYFTDGAHPSSGMARERNTSGDLVTTGGTGFGVMALIVGVERGFISRDAAVSQLQKIVAFLERADRWHGAWPHWLDGRTGRVRPFSQDDDGADLVETALLVQGLLAVRQWADRAKPAEAALATTIDRLWREVDWTFFTRGRDVLYWHWSPGRAWAKNLPIRGWNEGLIAYVLAAGSPTHAISPDAYHRGWAGGPSWIPGLSMKSGREFEGLTLPLGPAYGGPLFFAHYSFMGLDPRGLADRYTNYFSQNRAHAHIHYRYCVRNPKGYTGYGRNAWGLTASDSVAGYAAHSPTDDRGVISPTAAVASMPYTPIESMAALRHFHDDLGERLFGPYGFYDAFSPHTGWYSTSTLAIDQGPIIGMIENHRTQLLWRLFMSCPEVASGLARLGFKRG